MECGGPNGVTPQQSERRVHDAQAASQETLAPVEALYAANEDLREDDSDFQSRLAQVLRSRDAVVAQLNQAVQVLDRAEQNRAAAATTAAQHLAQQEAALALAQAEAATLRESLERQLANAHDRAVEAAAATERLTRREKALAVAVEAHQNLERRFSAALTLLQDQDAEIEAKTAKLTRRETELAEATETRLSLERRLSEAESALHEAVRRSADDRSAAIQQAAQRQSEFETILRDKVARYDTLAEDLLATRQKLAHAETMLEEAESRHALAMTTAAAQRSEEQLRYEARMAEAAATRDLVDQQLREVEVSLEQSRQERAEDAAATAERVARLDAQRVEILAKLQMLEEQLAAAAAALHVAEQRVAVERLNGERQAAQCQAEFEANIAREIADRHVVEQDLATSQEKLAESESARRDDEQRHVSIMASAAAQFAEQKTALERRLTQSVSAHAALERKFSDAQERHSSEMATTAALFAERQSQYETRLTLAATAHAGLEQDLVDAQRRHASEIESAAEQFAERQRQYENLLAQAAAVKDANDLRLREAEATLEQIRNERAAEASTAAQRFAQLESDLAKATANGQTLERRLAEVTTALQDAEQLLVSERVASSQEATERQIEFEARLSLEIGTRHTIEQTLAAIRQDLLHAETALRDARQQHTTEMASAATELSEQHSQYTTRLAQASAAQAALEQKLASAERQRASAMQTAASELAEQRRKYETHLAEVSTAREIVDQQLHEAAIALVRIRQESDANAIAWTERLSQRESELAAACAARDVLGGRLVDAENALQNVEQRALAERTAMTLESAQRQADFDTQLAREVAARNTVERDLAETRAAAEQTRQAFLGESAALTAQMRELEARLTQELARERAGHAGKLADLQTQLRALEAELARVNALAAERDRQLEDQAACDAAAQHAAKQALAGLETKLRAAATVHGQQVEELESRLKALTRDLDATKLRRDALQVEADRVPQLTKQLEATREESRRQFDISPIGILRCGDTGALHEANRAVITLLGYRSVDELRARGSTASVFESPDDLRWLIERCEGTPNESVDCIWKKKDGSRLVMRLRAVRIAANVVEIMAEDLTSLRAVEERLRQAQRMEAVGRVASEVAVTCDNLLRNVSRDGQQWLATVGSNTTLRRQGELIFAEVTRAASFLRQLSVYGEKTGALSWVDVNKVLRDLTPVLKRVAGDDIELVLPKKDSALTVDVDAERVERVLVNIAAYGRARMPSGGRLIVELARVVVGREFVTKYPNVRQGGHALISVTEVRTAAPTKWPIDIRETVETPAIAAPAERPGVDLGALQALIGDCGGHLWMKAEPGGDLEVKIHLPLYSAEPSRKGGVVRSARGRSVTTWVQS